MIEGYSNEAVWAEIEADWVTAVGYQGIPWRICCISCGASQERNSKRPSNGARETDQRVSGSRLYRFLCADGFPLATNKKESTKVDTFCPPLERYFGDVIAEARPAI